MWEYVYLYLYIACRFYINVCTIYIIYFVYTLHMYIYWILHHIIYYIYTIYLNLFIFTYIYHLPKCMSCQKPLR